MAGSLQRRFRIEQFPDDNRPTSDIRLDILAVRRKLSELACPASAQGSVDVVRNRAIFLLFNGVNPSDMSRSDYLDISDLSGRFAIGSARVGQLLLLGTARAEAGLGNYRGEGVKLGPGASYPIRRLRVEFMSMQQHGAVRLVDLAGWEAVDIRGRLR